MTRKGLVWAYDTLKLMKINLADAEARQMHEAVKNIKAKIKQKEEEIKDFYKYGETNEE